MLTFEENHSAKDVVKYVLAGSPRHQCCPPLVCQEHGQIGLAQRYKHKNKNVNDAKHQVHCSSRTLLVQSQKLKVLKYQRGLGLA